MNKVEWRKQLRARRGALSSAAREAAERDMLSHFFSLPAHERTGHLLLYMAVPPEAPTRALIEKLWSEGETVYLPRLHRDAPREMDIVPVTTWSDLVPGPYFDIPQPAPDVHCVDAERLDVVVLPGVGFDSVGRRVGQAGGYYDRLLSRLPERIVRLGWAFDVQRVDRLPEEPHDERVDLLITDGGVFRFKEGAAVHD